MSAAAVRDQRRKPIAGFPSQAAACAALADRGLPPEEIATAISRDVNHVRATLRRVRMPPKPYKFALDRSFAARLAGPAAARGITAEAMASELLDAIIRDDLFDALLGEPEASRG